MHTARPKITSRNRAAVIAVCVLFGIVAALVVVALAKHHSPMPANNGYLPKDVPSTPAASPLASAPPEAPLHSDAVSINLPAGSSVGPHTVVSGTAASRDSLVYYRISDYRRGQIAAGQVSVPTGGGNQAQPFSFHPEFSRVYTKGDPATLDIYVLDANGAEQTSRVTVKLR